MLVIKFLARNSFYECITLYIHAYVHTYACLVIKQIILRKSNLYTLNAQLSQRGKPYNVDSRT